MEHPFLRNEMLWGPEAQARLARAHVLLLGLGGVAATPPNAWPGPESAS